MQSCNHAIMQSCNHAIILIVKMKKSRLITCLALAPLLFALVSGQQKPAPLPNIVVIFADDLAYADVGCFGAGYATPHLDRLAAGGARFTHFYAQPQCSPSRAALMTGCYPQRVGIPWVVGPKGPAWTADKHYIGLHPSEQTLAELLKTKGYATACVGKWHLGHDPVHLPTRHGFDEYFGLPYSNDMYPGDGSEWGDLPLIDGEKTVELNPDQGQLTRRYTQRAVDFIKRNRQKPFFLYLAHSMPHVPIFASGKFRGKSGRGLYADVVQELDWSVGEVHKALKKQGLADNTLVIFTSDNGPWLVYGNHAGSSGPLRAGKATVFEGGVRVPTIVHWPGRVPAGSTCAQVAGLIDLWPTVAEVVGAPRPAVPLDGRSLLPLLQNPAGAKSPREYHYYFQINELQAIRQGKWKLHVPHNYEQVAQAGQDGQRGKSGQQPLELSLYDLEADPGEQTNLAAQHPEVVERLRAELLRFGQELKAQQRPAGKAHP
jgi:arylsulfatase A